MVAAETPIVAGTMVAVVTIVEAAITVQPLAGPPLSNATSDRRLHTNAPQPPGALPPPATLPLAQTIPPALSETWRESVNVSSESSTRTCAGHGHAVHETGGRSAHTAGTRKRNAHAAGTERTSARTAGTERTSAQTAATGRRSAHAAGTGKRSDHAAGIASTTTRPVTSAVTRRKKTSTETGRRRSHTSTKAETKSADDDWPPHQVVVIHLSRWDTTPTLTVCYPTLDGRSLRRPLWGLQLQRKW